MQLDELSLRDFRSYTELDLRFGEGLTAIVVANGAGKSNLLEAVAYLATLSSFRGAPTEALVRRGADQAVVRGQVSRDARHVSIEAEIRPGGRGRVLVNRQRLARRRDLLEVFQVSVFTPDDLELVKGGPKERRDYIDSALVGVHPANEPRRAQLEKVLRQRNALLKQSGGRMSDDVATTLAVWDAQLVEVAEDWATRRIALLAELEPRASEVYQRLSGDDRPVTVGYTPAWHGRLAEELVAQQRDELRRGVSLVGPHRDEIELFVTGLPARTHASQGEQRSLALALRLAVHLQMVDVHGTPPVLLLDDVFSELDPARSRALVAMIPPGQTLLTTAGPLPGMIAPEQVLTIEGGRLVAAPGVTGA